MSASSKADSVASRATRRASRQVSAEDSRTRSAAWLARKPAVSRESASRRPTTVPTTASPWPEARCSRTDSAVSQTMNGVARSSAATARTASASRAGTSTGSTAAA